MKLFNPQSSLLAGLCLLVVVVLAFNPTGMQAVQAATPHTQNSRPFWQDDEPDDNEWDEEEEDEEEDWDDREEEQEWEEDEDDIEFEFQEIEFERASVEMNIGRLEVITRLTEIAESETSMAGYAIMHIGEFLEAEEAIDLLEEVQSSDRAPRSVRNLAKMKLAELYVEQDRVDDVKNILRSLLMFR